MRNRNTLHGLEFVCDSIYWSALFFLFYHTICFRPVFALDYALSTIILIGTALIGTIGGILLTYKQRRNYVSIFCNTVLSFGPYCIMSFWHLKHTSLVIAGFVALGIVLLYSITVLIGYIDAQVNGSCKASIWQWIKSYFLSSRTLISFVLVFLLLDIGLRLMLGLPLNALKSDGSASEISSANSEGETISKNMDIVLLLEEDKWCHLNTEEKLKVMKTIADIEANYLGIEKMTVRTENLDEDTLGYYTDPNKTITLNLSYLSTVDAKTMLSVLCHECYHAYQHRLVELYNQVDEDAKRLLLFRDAAYYKDEFANYIDGSTDHIGYSSQWCELDSEKYAEDAVFDYYHRIYQYNEEKNGGTPNE